MPSSVDICNLALSHINAPPIQSLTEKNRQARECNRLYELTRDAVLSEFPWNFAEKQKNLAEVSGVTFSGWDYVYTYPSDCLTALEIYNPVPRKTYTDGYYQNGAYIEGAVKVQSDKIQFEIKTSDAKDKRYICTNEEQAELIYTARVEDANIFSSSFIDALSWRLAADLAMPLKGSLQLHERMLRVYEAKLGRTRALNANEGHEPPDSVSSYVVARK